MAPPLLPLMRPLIAMPIALRAANTIMGLMVMQGITMSMWRGMLNQNIPSVDMRASRPRLTFEMSNRQPSPPASDDKYFHKKHEDRDYYGESRSRRKYQKKEIQVLQMIPIVQPIHIPTAVLPAHTPGQTVQFPFSSQAVNQDQQAGHQLLQLQLQQQSPQSSVFVIPLGQSPGGRKFLLQPVAATSGAAVGFGSATLTETTPSTSTSKPPPLQHAITIIASGSSPIEHYHERLKGEPRGSGAEGGGSKKMRKKKKKSKKVIKVSLQDSEALHEDRIGLLITGTRKSSCSYPDNDKAICNENGDSDSSTSADADNRHDDKVQSEGQTHVQRGKEVADELMVKGITSPSTPIPTPSPNVNNNEPAPSTSTVIHLETKTFTANVSTTSVPTLLPSLR